MPFGEHLEELRRCIVSALIGVVPVLVLALWFGPSILGFLIHPVQEKLRAAGQSPTLQSTGPLETFSTYLQVAVIATLVVSAPWVLWNLWRFVSPGLYSRERRFVYLLIPMSTALTVLSMAFLYTVALPVTLFFLINFGSDVGRLSVPVGPPPPSVVLPTVPMLAADPPNPEVGSEWINQPLMQLRVCVGYEGPTPIIWCSSLTRGAGIAQNYRVAEYVKLFLGMALAFALAFQLPVVVLLFGWIGVIDREFIRTYRKHAIFACAVVAALLTPGDPSQMLMLGFPLWFLYELGGLLLRFIPARDGGGDDEEERPSWLRRAPVRGLRNAAKAVIPAKPDAPAEPPDAGDE